MSFLSKKCVFYERPGASGSPPGPLGPPARARAHGPPMALALALAMAMDIAESASALEALYTL